jgi:hypothetical protein
VASCCEHSNETSGSMKGVEWGGVGVEFVY